MDKSIQSSTDTSTKSATITTIYYDGQFWSALIEKYNHGVYYTGRYVFGSEPTNPQLIKWMLYEFSDIPVYKTQVPVKIRINKVQNRSEKSFSKSLESFKNAQSDYLVKQKKQRKIEKREENQNQWELKKENRKKKKRH